MSGGVDDFLARMNKLGLKPTLDTQLVVYQIEPVEGALAGIAVFTAVEVEELTPWPQVPPHWIHLPNSVQFAITNSQQSIRIGWTRHSRQITQWGQDADLGVAWASHVRGVIGTAI